MKRAISGIVRYNLGDALGPEGRAHLRAAAKRQQERDTKRRRRDNARKHGRHRR